MNKYEVDLVRDAALLIEGENLKMAYNLMCLAHKYRPYGPFINEKLNYYKTELQVDNGLVNIHFGVHKTGTTYIQENLELILDQDFHYTKLDEFRHFLKEDGYLKYLKTLNWNKKIVISDENMIGGNGTILTGKIYPDFKSRVNNYLLPFANRKLIQAFVSIRPMSSFLPSQYCEYLRWNNYISYESYMSKSHVNKLSWYDTLRDTIVSNKDIKFYIFDFCNFIENKDRLLEKLSFGVKSKCDRRISRSRVSFTYKEISQLSNGEMISYSDEKFDPHSKQEKDLSMINYQKDLVMLAELPNVTMLL